MTHKLSFLIFASAALMLSSGPAPAGDKLIRPHMAKGARPAAALAAAAQAPTLAQTSSVITAHLANNFAKAAGSQSNLLTKQQAKASGWGWAADHFADIDKQNKGSVSLDDVLGYVRQSSNMALPSAAASQDIQIVH